MKKTRWKGHAAHRNNKFITFLAVNLKGHHMGNPGVDRG
jgi:hypothetical protein